MPTPEAPCHGQGSVTTDSFVTGSVPQVDRILGTLGRTWRFTFTAWWVHTTIAKPFYGILVRVALIPIMTYGVFPFFS